MKRLISFFILILIIATAANGQQAAISGTISDEDGPVPGVAVQMAGSQKGAVSDDSGRYIISDVNPGEHRLKFRALGYAPHERTVAVEGNSEKVLDIKLTPDIYSLDEVVVSGTRTERFRKDIPIAVDVITPRAFEGAQAVCLAQGLNYQAGLRTEVDCQTCNYTQVRMNGLQGGYTQILINSRPIFSSLNGLYGLEQIPANMIERIEVARGGGSALFGANAIAGTINIITRIPQQDSYAFSVNHGVVGEESNDNTISFNVSEVNEKRNAGLSLFANRRQRQEYDANGDDFSELPRISNHAFGANAFVKPSDQSKLNVSVNAIQEKRDGGDQLDEAPHKRTQSEFRDSNILTGNIDFEWNMDDAQQLSIYAGAQRTLRAHYTGLFGEDGYGNTDNTTFQAGAQHYSSFTFFNRPNNLVAGVEYQIDDVLDQIPAYNYLIDQVAKQWGVFVQSDWEALPKWTLLAGVRSAFHNLVEGPVFVPRLGFMYSFTETSKLRFSYARGFRPPQAFDADLHIAFAGGGIAAIEVDPALAPEFSNSFTATYDWDNFQLNTAWGFTASGFYTRLYDAFVLEESGGDADGNMILEKRNGGNASVAGATFEARARWEGVLELNAGITWQRSLYDRPVAWSADIEPSRNFMRAPDLYGFYTLTFFDRGPFNIFLTGIHTGPMRIPHYGGAPGIDGDRVEISRTFLETNLKASYTIDLPNVDNSLEISLGVQNMFDQYQQDFDIGPNRDSNYVYGPSAPRAFFAAIKYGVR